MIFSDFLFRKVRNFLLREKKDIYIEKSSIVIVKMEQQNFTLSKYALINATVDYVTTSTHVAIVKQVYEKGEVEAKLKSSEYEEFKRVVPELVNSAQAMYDKIERNAKQEQQQQQQQQPPSSSESNGKETNDDERKEARKDGKEINDAAVAIMPEMETADENPQAASNHMVDLPVELWQIVKKLSPRFLAKLSIYKSPQDKSYVTLGIRQYFIDAKGVIRFKRNKGLSLTFQEIMSLTGALANVETFFREKLSSAKVFDVETAADIRAIHQYVDHYWRFGGAKCRIVLRKSEAMLQTPSGAEEKDIADNDDDHIETTLNINDYM